MSNGYDMSTACFQRVLVLSTAVVLSVSAGSSAKAQDVLTEHDVRTFADAGLIASSSIHVRIAHGAVLSVEYEIAADGAVLQTTVPPLHAFKPSAKTVASTLRRPMDDAARRRVWRAFADAAVFNSHEGSHATAAGSWSVALRIGPKRLQVTGSDLEECAPCVAIRRAVGLLESEIQDLAAAIRDDDCAYIVGIGPSALMRAHDAVELILNNDVCNLWGGWKLRVQNDLSATAVISSGVNAGRSGTTFVQRSGDCTRDEFRRLIDLVFSGEFRIPIQTLRPDQGVLTCSLTISDGSSPRTYSVRAALDQENAGAVGEVLALGNRIIERLSDAHPDRD